MGLGSRTCKCAGAFTGASSSARAQSKPFIENIEDNIAYTAAICKIFLEELSMNI